MYENGAQDNASAWICANYPNIHWIRSNYQTYCYGGPSNDGSADNKGKRNKMGPNTWGDYKYSSMGQHQWAFKDAEGREIHIVLEIKDVNEIASMYDYRRIVLNVM